MTAGLKDYAAGKRFAVLGLGRTGTATALALQAAGAGVVAWDDHHQPENAGFPVRDLLELNMADFEALVMSPGIPHTYPAPHPVAAAAKRAGIPLIGDTELLMRANAALPPRLRRYFWGITGTNGKSTTTVLVARILSTAGVAFSAGGNLGPAALSLPDPGPGGIYVLEMSSYQLELLDRGLFDVPAFLNLSPDHLERHNGLAGYTAAKRRIFERSQPGLAAGLTAAGLTSAGLTGGLRPDSGADAAPPPPGGHAVICVDQAAGQGFARSFGPAFGARTTLVSTGDEDATVSAVGGLLRDREYAFEFDLRGLAKFPGRHNWQNFAVAYAMCRHLRLEPKLLMHAMRSFGGLAHRQEHVGQLEGVLFVNDSKGTNPEATEVALSAYERCYWIVGGQAKADGIKPLLGRLDRVVKAYLIGEATDVFADTLSGTGTVVADSPVAGPVSGHLPFHKSRTLDAAVRQAFSDAKADQRQAAKNGNTAYLHNPVILLSPACASFDQFQSFEARGDAFRACFERLKAKPDPKA